MKQKLHEGLDFEVDKLTNSIENSVTGEVFDTQVFLVDKKQTKQIQKKDWQFDWREEIKDKSKEVYALSTINNPQIIQGLVSVEDKGDHIFMHLVESAFFNKGRDKMYLGVPGNLVAYACKVSSERGYAGFVAFDSKTVLIRHYEDLLGATHLGGIRMYIDTKAAFKLITRYFK